MKTKLLLLFSLLFTILVSAQSVGDVIVTEFLPDPSGSEGSNEWFEVQNTTGSAINIEGWTIRDRSSSSRWHLINSGGALMIPAGGYAILANTSDNTNLGGATILYNYGSISQSTETGSTATGYPSFNNTNSFDDLPLQGDGITGGCGSDADGISDDEVDGVGLIIGGVTIDLMEYDFGYSSSPIGMPDLTVLSGWDSGAPAFEGSSCYMSNAGLDDNVSIQKIGSSGTPASDWAYSDGTDTAGIYDGTPGSANQNTLGGSTTTPPTSGQVIGEFPEMDGGMEDQTADSTMSTAGSSQSGTASTQWTVSSSSNSAVRDMTNNASLARTGHFSAAFAVTPGQNNLRMQSPSPTNPTLQTNTEYTVQYFYSAPTDPTNDLDAGIYLANTSGGVAGNTTDVTAFAANTYTKTYRTITTGATFNASNWAVARLDGDDNNYTDTVRIDDFVTYAGAYDDTAPNDPTSPTYANNGGIATIGWSAPSGGVDGGGYVVVKYTTAPNSDSDPSQNGIYEYGNTTTNGTGGLTGTVAYIGTDTSFSDTYAAGNYYKIYAVDKAFNYSDEVESSDALLNVEDNELADNVKMYPNPANDIINIQLNNIEVSKISIYNILGKEVLSQNELIDNRVDVSNLNEGIYFIKIQAQEKSSTRKIIIK